MPNVNSLEYQRTLQKQEKAVELMDIWAAILDAAEAIKALGGSYPDEHIRKAQDALLRAGKLATGDLTDDVIKEIATVGTARIWAANMGQVFAGETIIDGTSGETYICTVTHQAQALYAPAPRADAPCSASSGRSRRSPAPTSTSHGASTSPTEPFAATPLTESSTPPSRRRASRSTSPITRTLSPRSTNSTGTAARSPSPAQSPSRSPVTSRIGTSSRRAIPSP